MSEIIRRYGLVFARRLKQGRYDPAHTTRAEVRPTMHIDVDIHCGLLRTLLPSPVALENGETAAQIDKSRVQGNSGGFRIPG